MKNHPLIQAYILLALIHLVAATLRHEWMILLTKPLLLTLLAVWFYRSYAPRTGTFFKLILAGLVFSVGGDTLLMLVDYGPRQGVFFLLGLGSFLLAQVCYAAAFLQRARGQRGWIQANLLRALPLIAFFGTMLAVLLPNMEAAMRLPVAVYALAITVMVGSVVNLKGILDAAIFRPLLAGVLLFLLSDTLIAVNKFLTPLPLAGLAIMSTYLLAQYLIATNAAKTDLKI